MAVPSEERRARNRQAAKASRERQRAEMAALQLRVAELEAENARIRAGPSTPATGSEPAAASLVPWVESASFMERPPWYDSPTLTHTGAMYLPPTPVTRNVSFSPSSDSVSHEPELRPIQISPPRVSIRLPRPAMSTDAWSLHEERRKSGPRILLPSDGGSPEELAWAPASPVSSTRHSRKRKSHLDTRLASVQAQLADMNALIVSLVQERDASSASSDDSGSDEEEQGEQDQSGKDTGLDTADVCGQLPLPCAKTALDDPSSYLRSLCIRLFGDQQPPAGADAADCSDLLDAARAIRRLLDRHDATLL